MESFKALADEGRGGLNTLSVSLAEVKGLASGFGTGRNAASHASPSRRAAACLVVDTLAVSAAEVKVPATNCRVTGLARISGKALADEVVSILVASARITGAFRGAGIKHGRSTEGTEESFNALALASLACSVRAAVDSLAGGLNLDVTRVLNEEVNGEELSSLIRDGHSDGSYSSLPTLGLILNASKVVAVRIGWLVRRDDSRSGRDISDGSERLDPCDDVLVGDVEGEAVRSWQRQLGNPSPCVLFENDGVGVPACRIAQSADQDVGIRGVQSDGEKHIRDMTTGVVDSSSVVGTEVNLHVRNGHQGHISRSTWDLREGIDGGCLVRG